MKKFDLLLSSITIVLTLFGLLMIYDASSVIAFNTFGDKYHFIKDQVIWVALGIGALLLFAHIDYHRLFNLALPLLVVAMCLLIGVFFVFSRQNLSSLNLRSIWLPGSRIKKRGDFLHFVFFLGQFFSWSCLNQTWEQRLLFWQKL